MRERVLFITTKNLDYLRNTQEINLLKKQGKEVLILGSYDRSYIKRLCYVYWKLLLLSRKKFDFVFVGFAPQLIVPFFFWMTIWNGFEEKHPKLAKWVYQIFLFLCMIP